MTSCWETTAGGEAISTRTSPIHNVTNAVATSRPAKLDAVRTAIEPGGHVNIAYASTSYIINYKDSRGLDYDGSNIHSDYNGWVQKLDRAIARQLATL